MNALLVAPRFPDTYWSFRYALSFHRTLAVMGYDFQIMTERLETRKRLTGAPAWPPNRPPTLRRRA